MAHHMDHTFSLMLEPRSESDFKVHYDARIQIQNQGGSGWIQLINVKGCLTDFVNTLIPA